MLIDSSKTLTQANAAVLLPIEFHPSPGPKVAANPREDALDFQLLFRRAPSLLLVLEPAPGFRILDASDAYLRSRRTTRHAVVGRPFFEAFPASERRGHDAGDQAGSLERVLATRTADSLNTPVFAADGTLRYIIHRLEAIELEVLKSARERDDALRQLDAARQELEAFAYSASRDLRTPLRAISRLATALKGLEANTRQPASDYLARIDESARHMRATIEGLLHVSRIDRSPLVRKIVDIGALSRRILAELQAREPHRRVAVQVADHLFANADQRLMAIVFHNVLGNAWKHSGESESARIEVGCREVVGTVVFFVRDNGVTELPGRALGLAVVRRAIERHGGQLWTETKPAEGATIHFTLS
jgi:signal transduction histidine kinase